MRRWPVRSSRQSGLPPSTGNAPCRRSSRHRPALWGSRPGRPPGRGSAGRRPRTGAPGALRPGRNGSRRRRSPPTGVSPSPATSIGGAARAEAAGRGRHPDEGKRGGKGKEQAPGAVALRPVQPLGEAQSPSPVTANASASKAPRPKGTPRASDQIIAITGGRQTVRTTVSVTPSASKLRKRQTWKITPARAKAASWPRSMSRRTALAEEVAPGRQKDQRPGR